MPFLHFSGLFCVCACPRDVCITLWRPLVYFMNFLFTKREITPKSLRQNIFTTHGIKIGIIVTCLPIYKCWHWRLKGKNIDSLTWRSLYFLILNQIWCHIFCSLRSKELKILKKVTINKAKERMNAIYLWPNKYVELSLK